MYSKISNIRIVTFHREGGGGGGVYKRLECLQIIFEKPKHYFCFITFRVQKWG